MAGASTAVGGVSATGALASHAVLDAPGRRTTRAMSAEVLASDTSGARSASASTVAHDSSDATCANMASASRATSSGGAAPAVGAVPCALGVPGERLALASAIATDSSDAVCTSTVPGASSTGLSEDAPASAGRILGVRTRRGLLDLDPRTLVAVLACASVLAFMPKSLAWELALVLACALLQALSGHVRMALGFAGFYSALWLVLNVLFPYIGGAVLAMFAISFTFARKIFLCLMVGSLLVADTSVHRFCAALARLRVPQTVLIPLTVTLRYFPTLADEATHIRDAMRLRDIPPARRLECFAVPLVMSATTTADELSRAATCRGIENPTPSTDTERLHLRAADGAVLVLALAATVATALLGGA